MKLSVRTGNSKLLLSEGVSVTMLGAGDEHPHLRTRVHRRTHTHTHPHTSSATTAFASGCSTAAAMLNTPLEILSAPASELCVSMGIPRCPCSRHLMIYEQIRKRLQFASAWGLMINTFYAMTSPAPCCDFTLRNVARQCRDLLNATAT